MKQLTWEKWMVGNEVGHLVLWARIWKALASKAPEYHAKESELWDHSKSLGKVVTRSDLFSRNVTLRTPEVVARGKVEAKAW